MAFDHQTADESAALFIDQYGRWSHWIPELGYSNFFKTLDETVADMVKGLKEVHD